MQIKELEQTLGISKVNLRYYESENLINPIRSENNYREYSDEDIEKLKRENLEIILVANKADLCHEHQLGMLNYSITELYGYDLSLIHI